MSILWSSASRFQRLLRWTAVGGAIVVSFALTPGLRAQESTAADAAKSRELVNSARSTAGLSALADDSRLDTIASAQAERMASRDAIYHNPNLKSDADAAGVNWQWIGENVGVGPDVQSVHDGFMASPGHHENIVYASYNIIGTGVALGRDGSVFVAQVFAGVPSSAPRAPAATHTVSAAAPTARVSSPIAHAAVPPRIHPAEAHKVAPAPRVVADAILGGVVNSEVKLGT